jgi:PPM family protein phosphatase
MLDVSIDDGGVPSAAGKALLAFDAAAHSSPGPRPENQDSAVAGPRVIALADGVGGNVGGSVASALVTSWLAPLDRLSLAAPPGPARLRQVIGGANIRLAAAIDVRSRLSGMATTLVAVLADEAGLTVAHIGDSRVYALRDGHLSQLTTDQTLVQTLLDGGYITAAEAAVHPQRSVVFAALQGGPADAAQLQVSSLSARPGDRVLLCSDGLSNVLPADDLRRLLGADENPTRVARNLVDAAVEAAASDNVTVVVADVIEGRHARPVGPVTAGAAAQPPAEVAEALEALWPGLPVVTHAEECGGSHE